MKRLMLFCVITIALLPAMGFAQRIHYIKKDIFTKIVSIENNANHADNILNVNVFYKMGKSIPWGGSRSIISYQYLGVDSAHNLHILREEKDDVSNLIFHLNSDNSGEITLIGQRSQKELLLITLWVKATNSGINTKYLGDLPVYTEK